MNRLRAHRPPSRRAGSTWVLGLLVATALSAATGCSSPCDDLKRELERRVCDRLPEAQRPPCVEGLAEYDRLPREACAAHLEAIAEPSR